MESSKESGCFLVREEPIQRLPRFVFAVAEAWRRAGGDLESHRSIWSRALAAKCANCDFALSGEELLALAGISSGNEDSVQLKRLRSGQCAREDCPSSHYRLLFYDTPELSWSTLLAECHPSETPEPQSEPVQRNAPGRRIAPRKIALVKFAQIGAAIGLCLLGWMWWQWHSGGKIPFLRQPEHFQIAPGPDPIHYR